MIRNLINTLVVLTFFITPAYAADGEKSVGSLARQTISLARKTLSAAASRCLEILNGPDEEEVSAEVDATTTNMMQALKLRSGAIKDGNQVVKARQSLLALRKKTNVWEAMATTEKRANVVMFEQFVILKSMALMTKHFEAPFSKTETSAIVIRTSEDILKVLRAGVANGSIERSRGEEMITTVEKQLADATKAFLVSSNETIALQFVLDLMTNYGGIIADPSTMFYGADFTRDTKGRAIPPRAQKSENELLTHVERTAMVAKPEEVATHSSPAAATGAPVAPPTPAEVESIPTKLIASAQALKEDVIEATAKRFDEQLGQFMKDQPVQDAIAYARIFLGPNYVVNRPTFDDISDLRSRLQGDKHRTNALLSSLAQAHWSELKLRYQMMISGAWVFDIMGSWLNQLATVPKIQNVVIPIQRQFKFLVNRATLYSNLAAIMRVLALQDPTEQLDELRRSSAMTPRNDDGQLIITFIRFVDRGEAWQNIMARLQQLADGAVSRDGTPKQAPFIKSSWDQLVLQQFQDYEKAAIKLGPLPLIGPTPDLISTAVQVGVVYEGGKAVATAPTWVPKAIHTWIPDAYTYAYTHLVDLFSPGNVAVIDHMFSNIAKFFGFGG